MTRQQIREAVQQYFVDVWVGIRLAFFIRARLIEIRGSIPMLATLLVSAILLQFLKDFVLIGPRGEFSSFGLPGTLFHVPLVLLAAATVATIAGRRDEMVRLAIAFSAVSLPIQALELTAQTLLMRHGIGTGWAARIPWSVWPWVFPVWLGAGIAMASQYLLGLTPRIRSLALLSSALIVAIPLALVYRERTLWHKPFDEQMSEARHQYRAAANEDVFYQQPKLLARALDAIEPGRPGVIDLYYVGMGGYASQDVFLREIRAVEKLMGEQFGAKGRSVSLLNNPKTVMELPIASSSALKTVLQKVGEVMNREEDILVLFMTSHGAKDHKFALEFWPLQFNDLTPAVLRAALDDAGIKWRVVVVSACYAGGFIDQLKNDQTIVIAAAAPDKRSFGCSNEAEWTHFGKAFFDDSLRVEPRITKAFSLAETAVAARETKENIETPSEPQIAVGQAMEQRWDEYLAQLRDRSFMPRRDMSRPLKDGGSIGALLDLWQLPEQAKSNRAICLREMAPFSPTSYVEKQANYFGALTRSSPQWPRLVAAWESYAEEWCKAYSDPAIARRAFGEAWHELGNAAVVEKGVKMLGTPNGREYLRAERAVYALAGRKIAEARRPWALQATDKYQKLQADLMTEAAGSKGNH